MSILYANFSESIGIGKNSLGPKHLSQEISKDINHKLGNLVRVLNGMEFKTTLNGIDIQISDTSKEVIRLMIYEKKINKDNSSTLNDFLTNFYEPNETDVAQLIGYYNTSGPTLTLDNLKSFFNPTIDVRVGINLNFPGSEDVIQNRSRLSAYIILWYTIIATELGGASAGGRKRLSRVRHSSNNKRRKTRRRPSTKRTTRRTTRRR
jgi:hypothetical protein